MNIPYRVRVHPRARHVRLRVDPHEGLLVTVPPGFNQSSIPGLLASRREWIEQTRARQQSRREHLDPATHGLRPDRIVLPAIDECWPVGYCRSERSHPTLEQTSSQLTLYVPAASDADADGLIADRLQQWLRQRARQTLIPMTDALAGAHGIAFNRITIRNQRSRWGSCSPAGNLSLNAKLLLCSPAACRYVLIHELVHIEHPDHSPAFWARVAELEPRYREAVRELKRTWQCLPPWVI